MLGCYLKCWRSSGSWLHCCDWFFLYKFPTGTGGREEPALQFREPWCDVPAFKQPCSFNVLIVLLGQGNKHVLFSQKDFKWEAWSKTSRSFLYADQVPGAVSNETNKQAAFSPCVSEKFWLFPSIVTNPPQKNHAWPFATLLFWPIVSERIWKKKKSPYQKEPN